MTTPDTRAKELAGLLRAEVEFVKGDAAAWGADTYGDLPRTTALLNEAASLIEHLCREREKLREALDEMLTVFEPRDIDTIAYRRFFEDCSAALKHARSALAEQPQ